MDSVPLPRGWTKHLRSSVLHAIALATSALMMAQAGLHLIATTVGRNLKETEPVHEDVAFTIAIQPAA